MHERRQDPRTDTRFSLRNLLRTRCLDNSLSLAVLSTPAGMLMAGSREDRPAERTAAHLADSLFGTGSTPGPQVVGRGRRTESSISGLRFEVPGGALCLGVLSHGKSASEGLLVDMARRIRAILGEGRTWA